MANNEHTKKDPTQAKENKTDDDDQTEESDGKKGGNFGFIVSYLPSIVCTIVIITVDKVYKYLAEKVV